MRTSSPPPPPVVLGPDLFSVGGHPVPHACHLFKALVSRSGLIYCHLGMDLGRGVPQSTIVVFVRHARTGRISGYCHTPAICSSMLLSDTVRFSCFWVRFVRGFMAAKVCLPFPFPVCWFFLWMTVIGPCGGRVSHSLCAILWIPFDSLISALPVCWFFLLMTVTVIGSCGGRIHCSLCAILWIIFVFLISAYCGRLWTVLPLYVYGHYCWFTSLFLRSMPLSEQVWPVLFSRHCAVYRLGIGVNPQEPSSSDTPLEAHPSGQTFLLYFTSLLRLVSLFLRPPPPTRVVFIFSGSVPFRLIAKVCKPFVYCNFFVFEVCNFSLYL